MRLGYAHRAWIENDSDLDAITPALRFLEQIHQPDRRAGVADLQMIGQTLSHYKILEKLGEGGMGAVFLAEDINLDRKVALKVLPADMADDPGRLERFEREAKAIAALNHPNIVTIHSVEEADGVRFLTMELVEGVTLDEKIDPGRHAARRGSSRSPGRWPRRCARRTRRASPTATSSPPTSWSPTTAG